MKYCERVVCPRTASLRSQLSDWICLAASPYQMVLHLRCMRFARRRDDLNGLTRPTRFASIQNMHEPCMGRRYLPQMPCNSIEVK